MVAQMKGKSLIRRAVASSRRAVYLHAALAAKRIDEDAVRRLWIGWGNRGMAADIPYVTEVTRRVSEANGPVLECGSGLTTFAAALAARNSTEIHSLEHSPKWWRKVRRHLGPYGLPVTVHLAPLADYGDFDWYKIPEGLPARFSLVICDGPQGTTRGGRYGLLPTLRDRLSGATLIIDDANRPTEQQMLSRWHAEFGVDYHKL